MTPESELSCLACGRRYPASQVRYRCDCGETLEVVHDLDLLRQQVSRERFDQRLGSQSLPDRSGVWRYRELILPIAEEAIISKPEGNTNLYAVGASEPSGLRRIGQYVGLENFYLKHEGENPTGSFKDRGMTVGITQARALGARAVACASTGNTSASLAAYAAQAELPCLVFIPQGQIAYGKLSQALAYGALNLQIAGDFDAAMRLVQQACRELDIYLLNSLNPFRIEGQKSIALEFLQQLAWQVPDWVVLPAGNLGNTSALGKAFSEAQALGLIERLPRLAAVQAAGANPFYQSFQTGFAERFTVQAQTVASAIKIGAPVSYARARRAIEQTNGLVEQVSDAEILEAKAVVDAAGIGCEPASAATVAGAKKLVERDLIKPSDRVVGLLTGHLLKDPETTVNYHTGEGPSGHYQNRPVQIEPEVQSVARALEKFGAV